MRPQPVHGGNSGNSYKEKVRKMNRYRIYKVLKWIFVVVGIIQLVNMEGMAFFVAPTGPPFPIGTYPILAIFFKLQEDSNKPTI